MAFIAFDGEKSVGDLVSRVFGKLKAADAKRAEGALLRANPHLGALGQLARGALIVVPPVPGLSRAAPETDEQGTTAATDARAGLEAYRALLALAVRNEEAEVKNAVTLLESEELRRLLDSEQEGNGYLDRIAKAISQRSATNAGTIRWLESSSGSDRDLAELLSRLR